MDKKRIFDILAKMIVAAQKICVDWKFFVILPIGVRSQKVE